MCIAQRSGRCVSLTCQPPPVVAAFRGARRAALDGAALAVSGDQPRAWTIEIRRMIDPGKNCWRVDRASHVYCVQDAADYFRLVRDALLAARNTVFSLGWDITAHLELLPRAPAEDAPTRLDQLLAYIARRRPHLRCYILTWDYGALYTLERDPLTRWRLGWKMPRGITFGFDDHHPVGASHHQKVVVVDDRLAFCGGIDLTGHRWDTCAHRPEEPARVTPVGVPYGPYHEVQAMVAGPVAASLGILARDRWRTLGVDRMPAITASTEDAWPSDVTPDLTDVDVAIARTMPASESRPAVRECEALFLDSIAAAKKTIYIESQYFTNETLAGALAARLAEANGPEVVVVSPKECHGWLEKSTMGAFRESAFRQLVAADRHKRLRLVYPAASRSRDIPTFVHSKVMIVDDVQARIGSANFSHRSMGMDTECDLAVEAGRPDSRAGIRRIRDRLLAEHLGMSADEVARGMAHAASIGAFIDSRGASDHTLVRLELATQAEAPLPVLRAAADPDEPASFGSSIESLVPAVDATTTGSPLRIWVLPAVVLAAAAAVAARSSHTLVSIAVAPASLSIGVMSFVLAAVLLVPLELLTIVAAVCFGAVRGSGVAFAGSIAAAIIGYAAGRAIGARGLRHWISPRSYRSVRQVSAHGIAGMVVLRLASVASAGAIHLLCGAGRVPFATYLSGTVVALLPTIAVLGGLGGLLRRTLLSPTVSNGLATIGAAVLLSVVVAALRGFLLVRQFAPAISSHRTRAEFG